MPLLHKSYNLTKYYFFFNLGQNVRSYRFTKKNYAHDTNDHKCKFGFGKKISTGFCFKTGLISLIFWYR